MYAFHEQKIGEIYNIKMSHKCLEIVLNLDIWGQAEAIKLYSQRNKEQIEPAQCFLAFGPELLVLPSAVKIIKFKIYRTIILPVVLHGCDVWSCIKEEHGLRVFDNRVLRRIFGPRRDEVTGEWRKLHNVELNDLYCSPSIVRVITSKGDGIGEACST